MSKKQTKEIAVIDLNNYPMLLDPSDAEGVIDAIQENFEGEELSSRELFPVIPNMKGESSWNGVETEDGPQSFNELTGVILYIGSNRVLFEGDYGSGSKIPLCSSPDAIMSKAVAPVVNASPVKSLSSVPTEKNPVVNTKDPCMC